MQNMGYAKKVLSRFPFAEIENTKRLIIVGISILFNKFKKNLKNKW
jgi:hypothetical protein